MAEVLAPMLNSPDYHAYRTAFDDWLAQSRTSLTFEQVTGEPRRCLVMIPRVMQPHAEKVGDRYRFVGPCIDPRREDPADWTPPPGDGPLALLAFGTSYTDRIDVYRNTIEALDGNGWRLVIATGRVEVDGARHRPAVGPAPLDGPAACGVTGRGRVRHPRRDGLLHRGTVVRRPHGGHSTGRRPTAQRSPTRGAGGRPPPHRRLA